MRKQLKKLSLSTETLRLLDRSSLQGAAGGSNVNTVCLACNSAAAGCTATYLCSGCQPCD
jgi:hypothetical protein